MLCPPASVYEFPIVDFYVTTGLNVPNNIGQRPIPAYPTDDGMRGRRHPRHGSNNGRRLNYGEPNMKDLRQIFDQSCKCRNGRGAGGRRAGAGGAAPAARRGAAPPAGGGERGGGGRGRN